MIPVSVWFKVSKHIVHDECAGHVEKSFVVALFIEDSVVVSTRRTVEINIRPQCSKDGGSSHKCNVTCRNVAVSLHLVIHTVIQSDVTIAVYLCARNKSIRNDFKCIQYSFQVCLQQKHCRLFHSCRLG